MQSTYSDPRSLVTALHERKTPARGALGELLREPLSRLMGELAYRNRIAQSRERLTGHALHCAETYLRTRPATDFEAMTWAAFRGAVLFHVAKLAALPFGVRPGTTTGAGALPESDDYQSRAYSRPFERVGDFWFGGDWYGGYEAADGSLWVLLADVTGHGYFAYLLASTLPAVWRACCERVTHARPAHLLAAVHDVLADSLPEGIYAECTLVRLGKDGTATVVPAGGTRLLVRRNGVDQPVLHKLRGAWLGLARPSVEDESIWNLADGDELLLASDGCFDQLADHGDAVVERLTRPECLLDGVRNLLEAALAEAEQCDDITLVLLRRRGRSDDLLSSEAGDVRL